MYTSAFAFGVCGFSGRNKFFLAGRMYTTGFFAFDNSGVVTSVSLFNTSEPLAVGGGNFAEPPGVNGVVTFGSVSNGDPFKGGVENFGKPPGVNGVVTVTFVSV